MPNASHYIIGRLLGRFDIGRRLRIVDMPILTICHAVLLSEDDREVYRYSTHTSFAAFQYIDRQQHIVFVFFGYLPSISSITFCRRQHFMALRIYWHAAIGEYLLFTSTDIFSSFLASLFSDRGSRFSHLRSVRRYFAVKSHTKFPLPLGSPTSSSGALV